VKTGWTAVMVAAGLLGCGAQELQPARGSHDAGQAQADAPGRDPGDAGCPLEGLVDCPEVDCDDNVTFIPPLCVDGAWSCPVYSPPCPVSICDRRLVPYGCTCDATTAAIVCAQDAGAFDAETDARAD
jgi:hypothetical protein